MSPLIACTAGEIVLGAGHRIGHRWHHYNATRGSNAAKAPAGVSRKPSRKQHRCAAALVEEDAISPRVASVTAPSCRLAEAYPNAPQALLGHRIASLNARTPGPARRWTGLQVHRHFLGFGWAVGTITSQWCDAKGVALWHVKYPDGDEEDLEQIEAEAGFKCFKKMRQSCLDTEEETAAKPPASAKPWSWFEIRVPQDHGAGDALRISVRGVVHNLVLPKHASPGAPIWCKDDFQGRVVAILVVPRPRSLPKAYCPTQLHCILPTAYCPLPTAPRHSTPRHTVHRTLHVAHCAASFNSPIFVFWYTVSDHIASFTALHGLHP